MHKYHTKRRPLCFPGRVFGGHDRKMTKLTAAIVLAILSSAATADSETYDYLCKVDGKIVPLRLDDAKNILEWKGKRYSITVAECARAGWHADGNGTSFDFCTATQGTQTSKKMEMSKLNAT